MNIKNTAKIKEIFSSIQGEGLFVGTNQIFIRFCACNLNCSYCDTDFYPGNINDKNTFFEFTPDELTEYLEKNYNLNTIHSISLTGGEPLIWAEFLKEFLQKPDTKFYLETNATITDNLESTLPLISIIAGDIKLPSCSGIKNSFELHEKFFDKVSKSTGKEGLKFSKTNNNLFVKVVFDDKITDEEISKTVELAKKYNILLILQPRMVKDKPVINSEYMLTVFDKFVTQYQDTRLIPQVHKFINVE